MVCEFWHEYDGEYFDYEYCSAAKKKVICSGDFKHCEYKHQFKVCLEDLKKRIKKYIIKKEE